jgi:hypothetical protein
MLRLFLTICVCMLVRPRVGYVSNVFLFDRHRCLLEVGWFFDTSVGSSYFWMLLAIAGPSGVGLRPLQDHPQGVLSLCCWQLWTGGCQALSEWAFIHFLQTCTAEWVAGDDVYPFQTHVQAMYEPQGLYW